MSGFFGIFDPRAGKVDLESFEQMQKASQREDFDGMKTIIEDHIALGHLMLRVSPESDYDQQPLRSACGNYLLAGHFRLDYRDELGDKIGLTQSELLRTPDSLLAILAYQKWKENCVDHLEGDWAFVMYERESNKISLFRDQQGYCSLFYMLVDDVLYFSSDISALLAIEKLEHRLSDLQLLTLLMKNGSVRNGHTVMNNLYLLSGSTYLTFDSAGNFIKKFFEKKNQAFETLWQNEEDLLIELHTTFALAVRSRTRSTRQVGIFLSSGFDSTAVAYYLAHENENRQKRIFSYTSYPFFLSDLPPDRSNQTNEEPLVRKFVQSISNIDPSFLDFPQTDTLSISALELIQDPTSPISSINSFWIKGIFEEAKKANIRRMFCGQAGNYTISWDGAHEPANSISSGRFLKSIKDLRWLAVKQHKNLVSTVYAYLVVDFVRMFKYKFKWGLNFSFAKKHFARFNYKLDPTLWRAQQNDLTDKPGFYFHLDQEKLRLNFLENTADSSSLKWHIMAHSHGMEITDPTSDPRIVDLFRSLNGRYYFQKGITRYIYRKWMGENLPVEILNKKYRIMQAADIGYRMIRDMGKRPVNSFKSVLNPSNVLETLLYELSQKLKSKADFSMKRNYSSGYLRIASVLSLIEYFKYQPKTRIFDPQFKRDGTEK